MFQSPATVTTSNRLSDVTLSKQFVKYRTSNQVDEKFNHNQKHFYKITPHDNKYGNNSTEKKSNTKRKINDIDNNSI